MTTEVASVVWRRVIAPGRMIVPQQTKRMPS